MVAHVFIGTNSYIFGGGIGFVYAHNTLGNDGGSKLMSERLTRMENCRVMRQCINCGKYTRVPKEVMSE